MVPNMQILNTSTLEERIVRLSNRLPRVNHWRLRGEGMKDIKGLLLVTHHVRIKYDKHLKGVQKQMKYNLSFMTMLWVAFLAKIM